VLVVASGLVLAPLADGLTRRLSSCVVLVWELPYRRRLSILRALALWLVSLTLTGAEVLARFPLAVIGPLIARSWGRFSRRLNMSLIPVGLLVRIPGITSLFGLTVRSFRRYILR